MTSEPNLATQDEDLLDDEDPEPKKGPAPAPGSKRSRAAAELDTADDEPVVSTKGSKRDATAPKPFLVARTSAPTSGHDSDEDEAAVIQLMKEPASRKAMAAEKQALNTATLGVVPQVCSLPLDDAA